MLELAYCGGRRDRGVGLMARVVGSSCGEARWPSMVLWFGCLQVGRWSGEALVVTGRWLLGSVNRPYLAVTSLWFGRGWLV